MARMPIAARADKVLYPEEEHQTFKRLERTPLAFGEVLFKTDPLAIHKDGGTACCCCCCGAEADQKSAE